jgi:P-type Cu2+ transporter
MIKSENNQVYLPLENVESEHCALIVDNGLGKVDGMSTHKVELNNNRALISGDDLVALIPKAVEQIHFTEKKLSGIKHVLCFLCE